MSGRRPVRVGAALTVGAMLAIHAAGAQPAAPRTRPARDVAVTYSITGPATALVPGGLPGPVTLSWDAGGQRLRAEAAGQPQVALLDLRGGTALAFDTGLRVSIPLPVRPRDLQPLTLEDARLVPTGSETVAGLVCTTYTFSTPQGAGAVCLTPDGVPLRGDGLMKGRQGRFTALSVRYGALPPELFAVPPGYMSLGGGGKGGLPDLRGLLGRNR